MTTIITVLTVVAAVFCQANTWRLLPAGDTVSRNAGALFYEQSSDRFFLCQGDLGGNHPYSEMTLGLSDNRWINALPHDTLYGLWADSTGPAYGPGLLNESGSQFIKTIAGYKRPSNTRLWGQYAYDTDSAALYCFVWGHTFRYRALTRRWDTLASTLLPDNGTANMTLKWGSLCYDPVNREVVLFGGGDVDAPHGNCGTWLLSTATGQWRKLNAAAEPPPRAYSPMVYDATNRVIVLFGGDHLDYLCNDTWVYHCDTRTWEKKHPALSPKPRAGHAMLHLPKSGKVVLLGGYEYTSCDYYSCGQYRQKSPYEIWTYDPASDAWGFVKSLGATDTVPAFFMGRGPNPVMAAVDTGDRILARNPYGRTYLMNCDASVVDVPGGAAAGIAADTALYRTGVYTTAYYNAAPAPEDSMDALLAALPENAWVRIRQSKQPVLNRDWGTKVFAPGLDQILVWSGGHSAHCGTDVAQYDIKANRWKIGFISDWPLEYTYSCCEIPQSVSFNNRPFIGGHTYDNYTYCPILKKLIHVHYKYTHTYDPVKMEWDSIWIPNPAAMVGYTNYYKVSLTPTPHGVFAADGVSDNFYLFDTLAMVWRLLTPSGIAVPDWYGDADGTVYDSKRDRMLMFRGGEAGKVYEYSFQTNILRSYNPSGAAPANDANNSFYRECVYIPAMDKILFAGLANLSLLNCAADEWESVSVTVGAGVAGTTAYSTGWGYDEGRDVVWAVGTNGETNVLRLSEDAGLFDRKSAEKGPHMAVSPNPFNPEVRISLTGGLERGAKLKVYDLSGRLVADLSGKVVNGCVTWNASGLASGMYMLSASKGNQTVRKKVIYSK